MSRDLPRTTACSILVTLAGAVLLGVAAADGIVAQGLLSLAAGMAVGAAASRGWHHRGVHRTVARSRGG